MRKILYIFIILASSAHGQYSPLQSQYMFNAIALNPAVTGSENALSLIGSFRTQWVGIEGAPRTQAFTAHSPIKNSNSAVGLQVFGDQIGVDKIFGVYGSYSYKFKFTKSTLAAGIAGGANMVQANYSELDVAQAEDQLISSDSPLSTLPEFSLGLHYYAEKYFVSLSAPMFMGHKYDGSRFKVDNDFKNYNVLLGGGYEFDLKNNLILKPTTLLKFRANNRMQVDLNLNLRLNEHFDVGVSYRTEEALVLIGEARANKQLSFMYSFGVPMTELMRYSNGSHELSIKYSLFYKTQSASPRFIGW